MTTRIALIGYGKMGQFIASLSPEHNCQIVATIDPVHPESARSICAESLAAADVCIDFSHPSAVLQNIKQVLELGKPLVVGTTGWHNHLEEVRHWVEKSGTGLVYGANFSIGMNLFSRLLAEAVKSFDKFSAYDVYGLELHHRQKADSPSGTAIELSKIILENSSHKNSALFDPAYRRIEPYELHFASIRAGSIPGTHTVGFDCEADTVELTHRVRSRSGFALGALQAAKWLKDRQGFYSFSQVISDILC
ncbi:4-hydroxy-tetrahydrodipicolinate reductase [Candidatus Cloacimonadaceae bacterium]